MFEIAWDSANFILLENWMLGMGFIQEMFNFGLPQQLSCC